MAWSTSTHVVAALVQLLLVSATNDADSDNDGNNRIMVMISMIVFEKSQHGQCLSLCLSNLHALSAPKLVK